MNLLVSYNVDSNNIPKVKDLFEAYVGGTALTRPLPDSSLTHVRHFINREQFTAPEGFDVIEHLKKQGAVNVNIALLKS